MPSEMYARKDAETSFLESKHFKYLKRVARKYYGVVMSFEFPNGWYLSVVSHGGSYGAGDGEWEIMPSFNHENRKTKTVFRDDDDFDEDLALGEEYYTVDLSGDEMVAFFNKFSHNSSESVIGWTSIEKIEEMLDWIASQGDKQPSIADSVLSLPFFDGLHLDGVLNDDDLKELHAQIEEQMESKK